MTHDTPPSTLAGRGMQLVLGAGRRGYRVVHGVIEGPGRRAGERLGRLVFERGDFEDTGGLMDHTDPRFNRYEASGWLFLRRVIRPRSIGPDDVFIDIGSGKGRIVFLAARMPFRRVIGVELAPELTETARRNIERNRHRLRCEDVELVTADATTYPIPDDVTHVYMANPFSADVFALVLDNLAASIRRRPRRLRLFYTNPEHDALVRAHGAFRHVRTSRGPRRRIRTRWIAVYEGIPGAAG